MDSRLGPTYREEGKRHLGIALMTAGLLGAALPPFANAAQAATVPDLQPSSVGANAATTILITGSGFDSNTTVSISGCPATNPGAVYPVPFPNPGPGQTAGSVQLIDSTRILLTTPTIIPAGVCDVAVGGNTLPSALTFTAAPERLTLELRNNSGRDDSEVWVSVGYNCPLSTPSPPYPPGTNDYEPDGSTNPDYVVPTPPRTRPRTPVGPASLSLRIFLLPSDVLDLNTLPRDRDARSIQGFLEAHP